MITLDRTLEPLCEALCCILGNTCRIARTAMSYSWNVSGRGALEAERCFEAQSDELHHSLSQIAEHIRGLGAHAVLDYSDDMMTLRPPTPGQVPQLAEMLNTLSHGHADACVSIQAAIDVAEAHQEASSVVLLGLRLAAHRKHLRRLAILDDSQEIDVGRSHQGRRQSPML